MAFLKAKLRRFSDFLHKEKLLSISNSLASSRCSSSDLDSDWEAESSYSELHEVPEGCVAMYVGERRQKFVVATSVLSHPFMRRLLERSAEEYGFAYSGGLTIPCEPVLFEHLLWLFKMDKKQAAEIQIDELLDFYHDC